MKSRLSFLWLAAGLVILMVMGGALFTVDQSKQAVVLQFGRKVDVHLNPGLYFKIPFIQDVLYFEKRILAFDLPEVQITTGDQKRLLVDTYTRYRIKDPVQFFKSVKPATDVGANMRLEALVTSTVRNVLGKIPLRTMLSAERGSVMQKIEAEVGNLVKELGLEIIDVRIIRTELPSENREAVFARMNSDLIRIAKGNRAEGEKQGQKIRSEAEKKRTILLAEAQKQSATIRGKGEESAARITAQSFGKDPEFYSFIRSLQAYRETLGEGTSMVLSTDHNMFRFFKSPERSLK